jgi:hypothetical protein
MTPPGQSDTDEPLGFRADELEPIKVFVKAWVSGWLEAGGEFTPDIAERAVAAYQRHAELGGQELPEPYERRLRDALEAKQ